MKLLNETCSGQTSEGKVIEKPQIQAHNSSHINNERDIYDSLKTVLIYHF
jgi:hypothetical protein